jgi:hypothetical protein
MAIHRTAGSKFFIGPVTDPDTIEALTDENAVLAFEEISGWVEVEEIEDLGELGDTAEEITFTALNNRRVRKMKGPRNAGTMAVVVGRDPLDDGQAALVAAERTDFNYAFKVEYNDARTEGHTNSVEYFVGTVLSRPTNLGNVSNVTRRTFNIGVNTAVYEVASELLSS